MHYTETKRWKHNKIMQGSHHWINVNFHNNLKDFLKEKDFLLCGLSMEGKKSITKIPKNKKICILLGNEAKGLTLDAKKASDDLFHIPMFGMTQSLNLSVSCAITLYELLIRNNSIHTNTLTDDEKMLEKTKYFIKILGKKLAYSILQRKLLSN